MRKIHPVLLLEPKLLHDVDLQYIVNQIILIDHKRDVSRILRQEGKHRLLRLALASKKFGFLDVQVAQVVERLIIILSQLGHHKIGDPMVRCIRSRNQFAGRGLVRETGTAPIAEEQRATQSTRHKTRRDLARL